jgi:hypothetical protein
MEKGNSTTFFHKKYKRNFNRIADELFIGALQAVLWRLQSW